MFEAIFLGLLRHALTSIGGALVAHAVSLVAGVPQVHDLATALAGGAVIATGAALSALHKVKTKSGADYDGLNK